MYVHFGRVSPVSSATPAHSPMHEPERMARHWSRIARDLREAPADDVVFFLFKAMTTWGTIHDFKSVLPRAAELASRSDGLLDLDLIALKLVFARWSTWPEADVRVVRSWLDACWRLALVPVDVEAGRLLEVWEAGRTAGVSGRDWMARWHPDRQDLPGHRYHLVAALDHAWRHGPWWGDTEEHWVTRPEHLEVLQDLVLHGELPVDLAQKASDAEAWLACRSGGPSDQPDRMPPSTRNGLPEQQAVEGALPRRVEHRHR